MFDYTTLDLDHAHADALNERRWTHPDSYGGHSPDGAIVAAAVTRDCDTLTRCNYAEIVKMIEAAMPEGHTCTCPDDRDDGGEGRCHCTPYEFRAGHWTCGWVDYYIVPSATPLAVLTELAEILCALSDYPVVNDSALSEMELDEASEYWGNMGTGCRIHAIKDSCSGLSIFAARSDDLPGSGELMAHLNGH